MNFSIMNAQAENYSTKNEGGGWGERNTKQTNQPLELALL